MNHVEAETFALDIFEGPLSFLLHLIQKSEICIHDVPIHEITTQYLSRIKELILPSIDIGAEFIGTASLLLWMKSKRLLPKHDVEEGVEEDLDPSFEIIYKVLEYCRFKEAAKDLATREEKQNFSFTRGIHRLPDPKKQLGIEHLKGEDLASLFQKVLEKAASGKGKIHKEAWIVSDKIKVIRNLLKSQCKIPFFLLFSVDRSKGELIVTFLALLELMKLGECFVGKEATDPPEQIFLYMPNEG